MSLRRRIALYAVVLGFLLLFAKSATYRKEEHPASVDTDGPWTDTVKRGSMLREVRGAGTLIRPDHSASLLARVNIADSQADNVRPKQNVQVDTGQGFIKGRVKYVSSVSSNGMRAVDIAFSPPYPPEAQVDLRVIAAIEIDRLDGVLYVGRPVHADANSTLGVFKVVDEGKEAERVTVRFGRSSVNTIEVLDGLKEGDKIIVSDISAWQQFDRIRLK